MLDHQYKSQDTAADTSTPVESKGELKQSLLGKSLLEAEAERTCQHNLQNIAAGVEAPIESSGKFKKGDKMVLLKVLYRKHVLEAATPATNQEFIAILMKELNMSKAGATTYAYNVRKLLGKPSV